MTTAASRGRETTGEFLLDGSPQYSAPRANGENVIDAKGGVSGASGATRTVTTTVGGTVFDGVVASVAFGFTEILRAEYGVESLHVTQYLDNEWDGHLMGWIKMENPPPPPLPSTDIVEEEAEVEVSAATSKRTD
ncbi:hypothetical protein DL764_000451 [Monosporascus ibericus]|uniref:Uncharacterized protein n=1 Tax=Monosporascus ibericus TaxID=155417 RepID=A0A4V1XCT1_9PEZI|nr:hypothetical protein DL764_000451 [Monosporascus ibericus]